MVEGVGPDHPLPKGEEAQDGESLAIGFRSTFWTTHRFYLLDTFHLDFFGRLQFFLNDCRVKCTTQSSFAVKTVKSTRVEFCGPFIFQDIETGACR